MTTRHTYVVITLLGTLCLEGCTPFGGFKAPPSEFEEWTKSKTSVLEVKKALLECGVIVISHYQPIFVEGKAVRQDQNSYLLGHRCMLSNGYEYNGEFGACKYKLDQSLPACQPDAVIPTRSVERRLNSPYCMDPGRNTPECQASQPAQSQPNNRADPSPSNCYGKGQPGCEAYWKDAPPKSVVVEATINDDFVNKFKIPDKQKYIDRDGTTPPRRWKKVGSSDLETRKALLECGSGVYDGKNAYELMKTLTLTQYDHGLVLIKKCMLVDGFEYLGNADLCANQSIPACQPDAIVPAREVERRINGAYCMDDPYLYECQPQSYERRRNSAYCKKYPQMSICHSIGQSQTPQPANQTIQNNSANPYVYPTEYPDKPTQLQQDTQKQNNRDMNNLLRNTAPKTGR